MGVPVACTGEPPPGPPPGAPAGSPTLEAMARDLGADVVRHLRRGYYAGRSTDIAFVPRPFSTVVRWSGEGLGTDAADPRTTHPTPWDYHQRVPLVLYGPGYIRTETSDASVDLADLAPTLATLLGHELAAPDGDPLTSPLRFSGAGIDPPRVIVVVAYDGGGWNLLERWPDAWPVLRRLATRGFTYTNATIGSAPAVTSAIHATMGTGVYPSRHGLSEITMRLPDGTIGDAYLDAADPRLLEAPTLADRFDEAKGNRSEVGIVAYESWHLGMMSHGAELEGGDRDEAAIWEAEPAPGEFTINEEFYELPASLPGEEDLDRRLRDLDGEDGAIDGQWNEYDLADPSVIPATPAFVEHTGGAFIRMLEDGRFGDDAIPDLAFLELKPTDFGGHLWNMVAPEEEVVLRAQDRVLGDIVRTLDRQVGRDGYVLAFTADHGQTPLPEESGGLRIHPDILGAKVDEYFGRTIVQQVTPSGVFLDTARMEEEGITVEEVARFVADYRYGDGLPPDVPAAEIPEEQLGERVFAAALPGQYLAELTMGEIAALGPGRYPEGRLTEPYAPAAKLLEP
jgi:hypothetical protein